MDRADAGHLTFGLNETGEHSASKVWPISYKVKVGLFLFQVFGSYLRLNEVEFCHDVWVGDVAMSVKEGEVAKTLISSIVITQPSRALRWCQLQYKIIVLLDH